MKRWISDEHLTALANSGRLREVCAIGKQEKARLAQEWNGTNNMEFVTLGLNKVDREHLCREGGVVNQPTHVGPAAGVCPSSAAPYITLPWSPSGNTAVRHANGAHYLRPEVTEYRQTVAVILLRIPKILGQYVLHVELSPPDARRRDADNALKSALDALVKAGYLPDDSMAYMRELHVIVNDDRRGDIRVFAEPVVREAA